MLRALAPRPLRARRRARDPGRRHAVLRRPADAPAPGREPHPQARGRDPGDPDPVRLPDDAGRRSPVAASRSATAARRWRRSSARFDEAAGVAAFALHPQARRKRCRWLAKAGGALDGVVAKRLDGPYVSGERAMLKVKRLRTRRLRRRRLPLRDEQRPGRLAAARPLQRRGQARPRRLHLGDLRTPSGRR